MNRTLAIIGLAVAMTAFVSAPVAANSVAVNAPGLGSTNFALDVTVDGGGDKAYVQDDTPNAEGTYRFSFRIDANNVSLQNNNLMDIVRLFDLSIPNNHVRVHLQWKEAKGNYKVWLWAREDSGLQKFRFCGKLTVLVTGDDVIEAQWQAGAGDGFCSLAKNGSVKGSVANLDNDGFAIDRTRLGAPRGTAGVGISGGLRVDEFESFRTLN